jgi:hypothetical protein
MDLMKNLDFVGSHESLNSNLALLISKVYPHYQVKSQNHSHYYNRLFLHHDVNHYYDQIIIYC